MLSYKNSIKDLNKTLLKYGIDTSLWGKDSFKNVNNLYYELIEGDSELILSPLKRVVNVVQLIIENTNKILIESGQFFHNNRYRLRDRPPSEKMKPKESIYEAALRCLKEELGVDISKVKKMEISKKVEQHQNFSKSYPNLSTLYNIYKVYLTIDQLPKGIFYTYEDFENIYDPVSLHVWRWYSSDDYWEKKCL